ncbi:hypothetical protein N7456_006686 [Penicillium angulare]|uniref:Uncharacterized protein n=1 Tax=Penicillium angulare TaxID=116970 RepID=A0A9W9KBX3_9EURO|nr:hypothetical protein N7456_006686 [Penicillium angulare]
MEIKIRLSQLNEPRHRHHRHVSNPIAGSLRHSSPLFPALSAVSAYTYPLPPSQRPLSQQLATSGVFRGSDRTFLCPAIWRRPSSPVYPSNPIRFKPAISTLRLRPPGSRGPATPREHTCRAIPFPAAYGSSEMPAAYEAHQPPAGEATVNCFYRMCCRV